MLNFDEPNMIDALEGMPSRARVAFAAACATRQLASYEAFADSQHLVSALFPREHVMAVWQAVEQGSPTGEIWSNRLEEVMELAPEAGHAWTPLHAYADDAIASLAYSIRCLAADSAQEAAWAARRAYEAADQAAIILIGEDFGPGLEEKILAHPIVARELGRQARDLQFLREHQDDLAGMSRLRAQAFGESVLSPGEIIASLKD